jgi:hypothetical protein
MSRGNPFDFDDEDDRSRRRDRDADEYGYDPRPLRRSARPGSGLGIASLVCGIVGLVIAVASGGPVLCAVCCVVLLPVSWVVAGIGALVGAVGIILGMVSRSRGNRSGMPIWGIATGAVAIVAAAVAIILPMVVMVNLPQPPNNPPIVQPQPVPPKVNNPPKRF